MKRFHIIPCILLTLAFIAAMVISASAEISSGEYAWQADILKLMSADAAPKSTRVCFEQPLANGAGIERRTYSQELVSNRGDVLNVEFNFALNGIEMGEGQWATVEEWLKTLVLSSVQNVQADSQSLASVIAEGYRAWRTAAVPGETGMPAWASENLLLEEIVVTVPYYPPLSMGVNGSATERLQQRLIELGYLDGRADGYYGTNTEEAVRELETYIRELEQDEINALPHPTASPVPTPTATPQPNALPLVIDEPLESVEKPEPTPVTQVDGVADNLLQAYLYSPEFKSARSDLHLGDEGSAVSRIQTRLNCLGYTMSAVDGIFGAGTARGVRIFQHYNNLTPTGAADLETQKLLFSSEAVRPDNAMLTVGSSGEEVSRLQLRLRVLGFASIAVDGGYGASTAAGVENLQSYLQEMECGTGNTLQNENAGNVLTVVNGIADPLLLDDFYSEAFPAIPEAMANGSGGRDVMRLQRRLSCLEYYSGEVDGQYGSGTAQAVSDFQRRNGLTETGIADRATLAALFNENAKKALKPYVLKVSVADQRVYAYAPDRDGEYTDLVRMMKCSTGRKSTPTPLGTFTDTCPGARWHYFKKFDCWAQYAFYIQGDIMFHSVLYNQREGKVSQSSVNHLGSRASHGCVRLSVEDAKWIWNHCPSNTKVIIF